jgi:hypothetical protein
MKTGPTLSIAGPGLSLIALVNQLPDAVEWAVVFRAASLFRQISAHQLRAMLGFPAETPILDCAALALTSLGKGLAFDARGPWTWPMHEHPYESRATVVGRLARRWPLLAGIENADCIGFQNRRRS